jgi:hypothetical protein
MPPTAGSSSDGSHIFFETPESLTSSDTDSSVDVYDRSGSSTTLRSNLGPRAANGAADALYEGSSAGGTHVFFGPPSGSSRPTPTALRTSMTAPGARPRSCRSARAGATAPPTRSYEGAAQDGSHVFIGTNEGFVPADTDGRFDIYDRSGATTSLVTTGPAEGNGPYDAFIRAVSRDGSDVFFETTEALTK